MKTASGFYRTYLLTIALAALVISSWGYGNTMAGDTSPPPTDAVGTPTLPTPVWPTETALPEATAQPTLEVIELPATGAGTTAKEVKAGNHTCCPAAHFQYYYCSGGGLYAYYLFAWAYSPHHGHVWSGSWSRWISTC